MYNNIENKNLEIIKQKVSKEISEYYLSNINNDKFIDLIKPGNIQSEFISIITNTFIKTEFELFMGYTSYQKIETIKENYRNGSHNKDFKISTSDIKLSILKDRHSDFYPSTISKYKNKYYEFVNSLLELFKLELSNKEIVNFNENVYGSTYSTQNIFHIQKVMREVVEEFKTRFIRKE